MANITADYTSMRSHVLHCVSSEKVVKRPIPPNTAHDNWLGDYYNPVWDGPGHCAYKKLPPLEGLNTEGDE